MCSGHGWLDESHRGFFFICLVLRSLHEERLNFFFLYIYIKILELLSNSHNDGVVENGRRSPVDAVSDFSTYPRTTPHVIVLIIT